jgi:hypothetical protein
MDSWRKLDAASLRITDSGLICDNISIRAYAKSDSGFSRMATLLNDPNITALLYHRQIPDRWEVF